MSFSRGLSNQNISRATAVVKFLLALSPSSDLTCDLKFTPAVIVEGMESILMLEGTYCYD